MPRKISPIGEVQLHVFENRMHGPTISTLLQLDALAVIFLGRPNGLPIDYQHCSSMLMDVRTIQALKSLMGYRPDLGVVG